MKRQHTPASAGPAVATYPRVALRGAPDTGAGAPPHPNRLAAVSATVGLVSLATSIFVFGGLVALFGLIFSTIALRDAERSGFGRRSAMTGLVTSMIAILVAIAVVICVVWFAHKTQDCYQFHQIHQWAHCAGRQFGRR